MFSLAEIVLTKFFVSDSDSSEIGLDLENPPFSEPELLATGLAQIVTE